jgi:hypothetical protein
MKISGKYLLLLGLITLIIFPLPAYFVLHYFEQITWQEFLQLDKIELTPILFGLEFGIIYAFFSALLLSAPIFKTLPIRVDKMVGEMNISYSLGFFLSLCAGVGEELLFRSGVQFYLGPWITSIIFVAIHGYFSIKPLTQSLYGLIILPFILLISFGFDYFGLWFAIAAHFAYDATLFWAFISGSRKLNAE